jgi:hypothetical protein
METHHSGWAWRGAWTTSTHPIIWADERLGIAALSIEVYAPLVKDLNFPSGCCARDLTTTLT